MCLPDNTTGPLTTWCCAAVLEQQCWLYAAVWLSMSSHQEPNRCVSSKCDVCASVFVLMLCKPKCCLLLHGLQVGHQLVEAYATCTGLPLYRRHIQGHSCSQVSAAAKRLDLMCAGESFTEMQGKVSHKCRAQVPSFLRGNY